MMLYSKDEIAALLHFLRNGNPTYEDVLNVLEELDLQPEQMKYKSCFNGYYVHLLDLRKRTAMKSHEPARILLVNALQLYLHSYY